jgi:hypothetical protein
LWTDLLGWLLLLSALIGFLLTSLIDLLLTALL